MTQDVPGESGLVRAIGVRGLTLNVVNFIVGSAIFVVPATVAADLGASGFLAYLVAALVVLVVALCFAEAGSRVTATGGAYAYVQRAFGPWAGFVVASLLWFANGTIASAAVANALVGTVGSVVPALGVGLPRALLLLLLYGTFCAVNVRGVEAGSRTVATLTILKLAPLLLLVAVGVWSVDPHRLVWTGLPTGTALGRSGLLLVFALTGMEMAMTPTGEIKDPARTVPRAAVVGVALTAALYVVVYEVALGVLGPDLARATGAPLAETAARVAGPIARTVLVTGAAVSMVGFLAGDLLSLPRSLFALGRDGLLPAPLGRVHPRFRTPHVAIGFYAALTCAFAIAGSFGQLALLNAIGVLFIYLGVALATMRLRRLGVEADRPPVVLPGGVALPLLGVALIVGLLLAAKPVELLAAGVFMGIASVAYVVARRARKVGR